MEADLPSMNSTTRKRSRQPSSTSDSHLTRQSPRRKPSQGHFQESPPVPTKRPKKKAKGPGPIEQNSQGEFYTVEDVLKEKVTIVNNKEVREFWIKWEGYPTSENSWEPEGNILPGALWEWRRKHPITATSAAQQTQSTHTPTSSGGSDSRSDSIAAKKRVGSRKVVSDDEDDDGPEDPISSAQAPFDPLVVQDDISVNLPQRVHGTDEHIYTASQIDYPSSTNANSRESSSLPTVRSPPRPPIKPVIPDSQSLADTSITTTEESQPVQGRDFATTSTAGASQTVLDTSTGVLESSPLGESNKSVDSIRNITSGIHEPLQNPRPVITSPSATSQTASQSKGPFEDSYVNKGSESVGASPQLGSPVQFTIDSGRSQPSHSSGVSHESPVALSPNEAQGKHPDSQATGSSSRHHSQAASPSRTVHLNKYPEESKERDYGLSSSEPFLSQAPWVMDEQIAPKPTQHTDSPDSNKQSSLPKAPSSIPSVIADSLIIPPRPETPTSVTPKDSSTSSSQAKRRRYGPPLADIWTRRPAKTPLLGGDTASRDRTPPAPKCTVTLSQPSGTIRDRAQAPKPAASPVHSLTSTQHADANEATTQPSPVIPDPPSTNNMVAIEQVTTRNPDDPQNDFYCFLPLDANGKKLYQSILESWSTGTVTEAILRTQLLGACSHPGTMIDSVSTQIIGLSTQADWSAHSSPKFAFIKSILDLNTQRRRIAICLARSGRLWELLEAFLQGLHVAYVTPASRSSHQTNHHLVEIALVPTDSDTLGVGMFAKADLIIGFDTTFDLKKARLRQVLGKLRSRGPSGLQCPSIQLIVPNTLEHVVKKQETDATETSDQLNVARLCRDLAGEYQGAEEVRSPDAAAKWISTALEGPSSGICKQLRRVGDLPNVQVKDPKHSTLKRKVGVARTSLTDAATNKRQRTVSPTSAQVSFRPVGSSSTDISASVRPQEANSTLQASIMASTGEDTNVMQSELSRPDSQLELIQIALATVQSELSSTKVERDKLATLSNAQEVDLGLVQGRYEEKIRELSARSGQLTEAIAINATLQTRLDSVLASNEGLRTSNNDLRVELSAAKQQTQDGPDTQDLDLLRTKAKRVDQLEKRLESSVQDTDYIRSQYQEARAEASARGSEVTKLQKEVEHYKQKASTEARKLALMLDLRRSEKTKRVESKAEAENRQLRIELERAVRDKKKMKEDWDNEKERRGMGGATRASSVPPPQNLPSAKALKAVMMGDKVRRPGTVSTNTSRAGSPALPPSGIFLTKTSPLQRTMALDEFE